MTEADPAPTDVVAAVIERDGRYLIGLRPPEKRHGGLWEFPGGKIDDGETAREAMRRELREELDVALTGMEQEARFEQLDEDSRFRILFFDVSIGGEARPLEHTELKWASVAEMKTLPLAPTDRTFANGLIEIPPDSS